MARREIFRGLILDDDMEPGYLRIKGTKYKTWVLTGATYARICELDANSLVASMAEVLGPGMHPLPADMCP